VRNFAESNQRFRAKAITVFIQSDQRFHGKRSPFSGDCDQKTGRVKTVIGM
jgi:hypothetical protein